LPACAKTHRARLLADQTRRVGLCGVRRIRAASHQIDAVANFPRLFEIERARRRFHCDVEICDRFAHDGSTRESGSLIHAGRGRRRKMHHWLSRPQRGGFENGSFRRATR